MVKLRIMGKRGYVFLVLLALVLALRPSTAANHSNAHEGVFDESVDDPEQAVSDGQNENSNSQHSRRNSSAGNELVAVASPGLRSGSFRFHVNDGFYYHRQRVAGGRAYLRCVNNRANPPCLVRASMTAVDFRDFVITSGVHNHDPDHLHGRVQHLRDSLLEACRARPNVRLDVIYHEVCRNVQREVSSRVSLLSMRPSMVRAQSEHRPRVPHSFDEFDRILLANQDLRHTLDGEGLIYRGLCGVEGHRSLVFATDRVLDGVGPVIYLFGDATYYSRPNNPASSQLYTIVTMRDNHVIPLMHALMESRTEVAYNSLFSYFRQVAPNIDPDFIVTDFETAQQLSLRFLFPRSRLTGCLWHYARAVCRNVRTLGLHALVRDVENARRVVRMVMGIPLVPADRLQEALNAVVVEARRLALAQQFDQLFHYIRQTWILGVGRSLSVFGVRHRTNNAAETHHRNLNSRLVRRPNVWRFLDLITESEDTAWRDLGRVELGLAPSRGRRLTSLLNDARIRSLSRQLIHREMDMAHFLSAVSWHLDSSLRDMLAERQDPERPPSPERSAPVEPPEAQAPLRDLSQNSRVNNLCPASDIDIQNGVFEPSEEVPQNGIDRSLHQVDDAANFEDLMDDNYYGAGAHGRGRGRGRRPRANMRGRGRGRPPSHSSLPSRIPSLPPQRPPLSSQQLPLLSRPQQRPSQPAGVRCSFRSDDFSDEEFLPDESGDDELRRWQECLVCNARVAHYTILGCGAFPLCGFCIRQWFLRQMQQTCPHCNAPTPGWLRLDFQ